MEWNQMIPEFDVTNLQDSLHFYLDLIGFELVYERKEDKFAFLQLEKVQIMLQELADENKWETGKLEYPFGRGINFEYDMENIEDIYNRLTDDNYPIFVPIEEHWYRKEDKLMGCKEFLVKDPDGYLLRFSEDLGEKNA
ncbi:MAG: VOC family protein [Clostridia bacterium]|nr:VOC family protein [Clostridia bacterium]